MARPAKPSYERNITYNLTIPPHYAQIYEQLRAKHKSSGKAWQHLFEYYQQNETTALNHYPHLDKYLSKLDAQISNGEPVTATQLNSIRRLLTRTGEQQYVEYLKQNQPEATNQ